MRFQLLTQCSPRLVDWGLSTELTLWVILYSLKKSCVSYDIKKDDPSEQTSRGIPFLWQCSLIVFKKLFRTSVVSRVTCQQMLNTATLLHHRIHHICYVSSCCHSNNFVKLRLYILLAVALLDWSPSSGYTPSGGQGRNVLLTIDQLLWNAKGVYNTYLYFCTWLFSNKQEKLQEQEQH